MNFNNKPYPYYDAPDIQDLRELVAYCGNMYANKIAFHWLENKTEKSKTYKEFVEDIEKSFKY